jgi:hypothetical protein
MCQTDSQNLLIQMDKNRGLYPLLRLNMWSPRVDRWCFPSRRC